MSTEDLALIQARLASLRELRDVTRAMRAMAASHVQESGAALTAVRAYADVTVAALATAASFLPPHADDGEDAMPDDGVIVAIGSQHGFVGGFNEAVLDATVPRPGWRLGIVGRRAELAARERGMAVSWSVAMANHAGGVLQVARQIAERLAGAGRVSVVFATHRPGGAGVIQEVSLLPVDPAILAANGHRNPPLHHVAPEALIRALSGEHLLAALTRAAMESLASENMARLRAMEAAEHNIGDRIDQLQVRESSLRQEAVTSEILEVTAGAEAILRPAL